MKYVVVLLCLGVGYITLPVTSQVAAQSGTDEKEPTPAEVDESTADDEEAGTEDAKSQASEKPAEDPAETKPADTSDENSAAKTESDDPADDKESEKPAKEAENKKPRKTAKVETKRVKVVVTLDGAFTAVKMTPVALRPEMWSQFEIVEVVPHGTEVHAGQTLIKFDGERIDEEIADLELDQHVSELAIRKAEQELPRLEKSLDMAADEAERLDKNAREDYDRYHKIERPLILKSVEYSLKSAQFSLDYEQDELDQLEKMYEADDLTEETEEIVLKRQRIAVDFAKFNVEQTKQYCDEILNVRLPRSDIEIKESLDKAALGLARAEAALALDVNRARYELEQLKKSRTKSLDRHAKLLADRALMEIKAPVEGIVYYGECEDGSWSDMSSMISKLKPENSVSADTVMMTILERRPLSVAAQVGEEKRPDISVGEPTEIVPPVENADWLPAKVKSASAVPIATGKFKVDFDLTGADLPEWIVAGMSCKAKVTVYDKSDAIVVPKTAVRTDKEDEEQKYVWVVESKDADAKAERRNVKLGKASGEHQEILSGLKQDEIVSLEDEGKEKTEAVKE